MHISRFLLQGDLVTRLVAASLLGLSIATWVVMLWKAWLLRRAAHDVPRATAAFWHAQAASQALAEVSAFDRHDCVLPLVRAVMLGANSDEGVSGSAQAFPPASASPVAPAAKLPQASLSALAAPQQRTRLLRGALHDILGRLQYGQILLASAGSIAPFIGLLGTVWGIRHALTAIAGAGQITIERVAGPVGEALVMTAAGLAVAIPAVFAYNLFGRRIARIEAELEGFAQDLRDL